MSRVESIICGCTTFVAVFGGALVAVYAQQQAPDPRLASQTIAAQQAVLALREAEVRALQEDQVKERLAYEARLETALEWLKAAQGNQTAAKAK